MAHRDAMMRANIRCSPDSTTESSEAGVAWFWEGVVSDFGLPSAGIVLAPESASIWDQFMDGDMAAPGQGVDFGDEPVADIGDIEAYLDHGIDLDIDIDIDFGQGISL